MGDTTRPRGGICFWCPTRAVGHQKQSCAKLRHLGGAESKDLMETAGSFAYAQDDNLIDFFFTIRYRSLSWLVDVKSEKKTEGSYRSSKKGF